jgi:oligopeptide transport system substrate-binding protein
VNWLPKGGTQNKCETKRMKRKANNGKALRRVAGGVLLACLLLGLTACFDEKEPQIYYGQADKPAAPELRWSAGGVPKVFDPARAAHSPDVDAVRALYEGLTDLNPQTLEPVAGIALSWEASADKREWTFQLRKNARWSNGEIVNARDFVRSWERVRQMASQSPHYALFENILGATPPAYAPSLEENSDANPAPSPADAEVSTTPAVAPQREPEAAFGVKALNDFVLQVKLREPSPHFPALVAHTVFRPVHQKTEFPVGEAKNFPLLSSGAFRLAQLNNEEAVLQKSVNYWNAAAVSLERVRFVAAKDTETALAMYKSGAVDVVSNARFEPLALKLLTPYKDFRRTTFSALNFYQFNPQRAPFDNLKVRRALALAVDRERLVTDALAGANEPARRFLPANAANAPALGRDVNQARALMREAGYENGEGFPVIKLLINRNEQQRQVAKAVATMWKRELGVETETVAKNWDEYQSLLQSGEYDVARRSVVLPTTEEATNMWLLFAQPAPAQPVRAVEPSPTPVAEVSPQASPQAAPARETSALPTATPFAPPQTEAEALASLPAVPLYFAASYTLVKPYVIGFETNILEAPSLKFVRLDAAWSSAATPEKNWLGASESK